MVRYTVNCSILLTDLPLLERPRAAARAGFAAVEFWWPFEPAPDRATVADFLRAVAASGCQLTSLNLYPGDRQAGEAGVLGDLGRADLVRASVDTARRIAEESPCRAFNILYGNLPADTTETEHDAIAMQQLIHAGRALADVGGQLLLEPRSAPRYALRTAKKALHVIDALRTEGVMNVRLLADFYHLAVTGHDVTAIIDAHLSDIGHIQIADAPGRGAPGTGELPLRSWLQRCEQRGYNGFVGLEYEAPEGDPFWWLAPSERS